jgi:hypothetical protein
MYMPRDSTTNVVIEINMSDASVLEVEGTVQPLTILHAQARAGLLDVAMVLSNAIRAWPTHFAPVNFLLVSTRSVSSLLMLKLCSISVRPSTLLIRGAVALLRTLGLSTPVRLSFTLGLGAMLGFALPRLRISHPMRLLTRLPQRLRLIAA